MPLTGTGATILLALLGALMIIVFFILRDAKVNRRLMGLTSNDFPGVDPTKLDRWKQSVRTSNRYSLYAFVGIIILNVLFQQVLGMFVGHFTLVLLFLTVVIVMRRQDRFRRELGIEIAAIKLVLKKK